MGIGVKLTKKINGFFLDIEWEVEDELAVLFGFSGAGKSLTLQMIAGLMKPDNGRVSLDGAVFYDSIKKRDVAPQKRPFGYVFQDLALFPHMSVMRNILYGAPGVPRQDKVSRAQEMIAAFKLAGLERRYPQEISGGQKQRVAFARALIRQPRALLLDEPFSSLDGPLRREMRCFLREIKNEFNIPIIMVTHDLEEASSLADRIIIYEHGKIAQTGMLADVLNHPANGYVSGLLACG